MEENSDYIELSDDEDSPQGGVEQEFAVVPTADDRYAPNAEWLSTRRGHGVGDVPQPVYVEETVDDESPPIISPVGASTAQVVHVSDLTDLSTSSDNNEVTIVQRHPGRDLPHGPHPLHLDYLESTNSTNERVTSDEFNDSHVVLHLSPSQTCFHTQENIEVPNVPTMHCSQYESEIVEDTEVSPTLTGQFTVTHAEMHRLTSPALTHTDMHQPTSQTPRPSTRHLSPTLSSMTGPASQSQSETLFHFERPDPPVTPHTHTPEHHPHLRRTRRPPRKPQFEDSEDPDVIPQSEIMPSPPLAMPHPRISDTRLSLNTTIDISSDHDVTLPPDPDITLPPDRDVSNVVPPNESEELPSMSQLLNKSRASLVHVESTTSVTSSSSSGSLRSVLALDTVTSVAESADMITDADDSINDAVNKDVSGEILSEKLDTEENDAINKDVSGEIQSEKLDTEEKSNQPQRVSGNKNKAVSQSSHSPKVSRGIEFDQSCRESTVAVDTNVATSVITAQSRIAGVSSSTGDISMFTSAGTIANTSTGRISMVTTPDDVAMVTNTSTDHISIMTTPGDVAMVTNRSTDHISIVTTPGDAMVTNTSIEDITTTTKGPHGNAAMETRHVSKRTTKSTPPADTFSASIESIPTISSSHDATVTISVVPSVKSVPSTVNIRPITSPSSVNSDIRNTSVDLTIHSAQPGTSTNADISFNQSSENIPPLKNRQSSENINIPDQYSENNAPTNDQSFEQNFLPKTSSTLDDTLIYDPPDNANVRTSSTESLFSTKDSVSYTMIKQSTLKDANVSSKSNSSNSPTRIESLTRVSSDNYVRVSSDFAPRIDAPHGERSNGDSGSEGYEIPSSQRHLQPTTIKDPNKMSVKTPKASGSSSKRRVVRKPRQGRENEGFGGITREMLEQHTNTDTQTKKKERGTVVERVKVTKITILQTERTHMCGDTVLSQTKSSETISEEVMSETTEPLTPASSSSYRDTSSSNLADVSNNSSSKLGSSSSLERKLSLERNADILRNNASEKTGDLSRRKSGDKTGASGNGTPASVESAEDNRRQLKRVSSDSLFHSTPDISNISPIADKSASLSPLMDNLVTVETNEQAEDKSAEVTGKPMDETVPERGRITSKTSNKKPSKKPTKAPIKQSTRALNKRDPTEQKEIAAEGRSKKNSPGTDKPLNGSTRSSGPTGRFEVGPADPDLPTTKTTHTENESPTEKMATENVASDSSEFGLSGVISLQKKSAKVTTSEEQSLEITKTTTSAFSELTLEVGAPVMARWKGKDTYYYPGTVSRIPDSKRCEVRFDDGDTATVLTIYVIVIDRLPIGQSVLVEGQRGRYEPGLVTGYHGQREGLGYVVELDDGTQKMYTRQQVILSADQAACLAGTPPADTSITTPNRAHVSLDNIVDNQRRSRPASTATSPKTPVTPSTPKSSRSKLPHDLAENGSTKGKGRGKRTLLSTSKQMTAPKVRKESDVGESRMSTTRKRKLESFTPQGTSTPALTSHTRDLFGGAKGRIPTQPSLFEGLTFMVSYVAKSEDRLRQEKKLNRYTADTSAEDSSAEEAALTQPFDKEHLTRQITAGGGVVVDSFDNGQMNNDEKCLLISDSHQRTKKYLHCLAAGIPCVSHSWIIIACDQGVLPQWGPYLLPAGISLENKQLTELSKKRSPFVDVKVMIVSANSDTRESWVSILTSAGAAVTSHPPTRAPIGKDVTVIVTDNTCTAAFVRRAEKAKVALVSTEWCIQSLICHSLRPFDALPEYRHDYENE